MGRITNNVGRRVEAEGVTYAPPADGFEEMETFDRLPPRVRRAIAEMPARANVFKYARLVRFQGEDAAIAAAREAVAKFMAAASAEKANGRYFEPWQPER